MYICRSMPLFTTLVLTFSIYFICSSVALAVSYPFKIIENGVAKMTVVYSGDPQGLDATMAHLLGEYVVKITGTDIGYKYGGTSGRTAIYIGNSDTSLPTDVPGSAYGPEAYKMSVRYLNGNLCIYLNGNSPEAVSYAVYSFIENNMGIRWFAPGETWEYVPVSPNNLTVTVEDSPVVEPDVAPRIWSGHNWHDSWKDWNKYNKNANGDFQSKHQFQNQIYQIFPPSTYGNTHPEYYPLINGQRYIPSSDTQTDWWPCESNVNVQNLTITYIRNWFNSNPGVDSYGLGRDDTYKICECGPCAAMDSDPDDFAYMRFSDRHFKFINIVAAAVKTTHPNHYIGTLMYWVTRKLPVDVSSLEDNVVGFITEESAAHYDNNIKISNRALTTAWASKASHLSRYEYMGLSTFVPRVYPHAMADAMSFDRSQGLEGMYMEVYTFLPNTAPMAWACAKLQWDSSLDIDDLLDEFYDKMFGNVASDIKTYYELLESSWQTPRIGHDTSNVYGDNQMSMDTWVHKDIIAQASSISSQTVIDGLAILNTAYNNASTPIIKTRIEILRASLEYASFAVIPYNDSVALSKINILTVADCQDIFDGAIAIAQKLADCPANWAAAYAREDILGETLRAFNSNAAPDPAKINTLVMGTFTAVDHAMEWLKQNASSTGETLYQSMINIISPGFVKDGIESIKSVRDTPPTNLAINGQFNANAYNWWDYTQDPIGWSVWSRYPDTRDDVWTHTGINDGYCAKLRTFGDDLAYFIQQLPNVQSGEKYVVKLWAKPFSEDTAIIKLRYKNSSNGWISPADNDIVVNLYGDTPMAWQHHVLYTKIPQGGVKLGILLGSMNEAQVRFDEINIYKVQ